MIWWTWLNNSRRARKNKRKFENSKNLKENENKSKKSLKESEKKKKRSSIQCLKKKSCKFKKQKKLKNGKTKETRLTKISISKKLLLTMIRQLLAILLNLLTTQIKQPFTLRWKSMTPVSSYAMWQLKLLLKVIMITKNLQKLGREKQMH